MYDDLIDVDEKLSDLLEDFSAAAEWLRQYPEDADGVEDLHRAYQAVAAFVAPTPHKRIETVTEPGHKTILIYRGFDLIERIEIEL